MVIDLRRCIGCNACTVACKQEHGTPEGIHFARVVTREMGTYPATKRTFLPVLCNHCHDAACVHVCPSGASYTRPDGIVLVNKDICIGCRACAVACPYMNRHFIERGLLQNTERLRRRQSQPARGHPVRRVRRRHDDQVHVLRASHR